MFDYSVILEDCMIKYPVNKESMKCVLRALIWVLLLEVDRNMWSPLWAAVTES